MILDSIIKLIDIGVDLECTDINGKQPIYYAIVNSYELVVSYLINLRVNLNTLDIYNYAPIHYAIKRANLNIVKMIIPI